MHLGFDQITGLFYEGRTTKNGHGLHPTPVITPASFSSDINNPLNGLPDGPFIDDQKIIFREDSFDPVTKIRRGRFYSSSNQQQWHSTPHPGGEYRLKTTIGGAAMTLPTFQNVKVSGSFPEFPRKQYTIALGSVAASTLWTVVGIEMISSGEELVTLRARSTMGALPELLEHHLPNNERNVVLQAVEKLSNDLYRSGPESIVDHCRDLAEHVLRAKIRLSSPAFSGGELSSLVDIFKTSFKDFRNIPNCAESIRIHHQRRKTAIQDKTSARPLMAQDAELCVYCIGSILVDLGWARWL
ncbi:hypothetical protein CIK05_06220 [Bdellovibrio sp. qaytius]|nr:hypothetical protein CIK05_06220 [Bdellovibrio sp. qaytius]